MEFWSNLLFFYEPKLLLYTLCPGKLILVKEEMSLLVQITVDCIMS